LLIMRYVQFLMVMLIASGLPTSVNVAMGQSSSPMAAEARRRAAAYRVSGGYFEERTSRVPEVMLADRKQVSEACAAAAARWDSIATDLDFAKDGAKEAFAAFEKVAPDTRKLADRLEARSRQADMIVFEENATGRVIPALIDLRDAWVEARRTASEAWADVADAITADAPADKIAALKVRAGDAEFDAEAADATFAWSRDFMTAIRGPIIASSPQFDAAMAKLKAARAAVLRQKREVFEQQRKLKDLDLERRAAEQAAADAYLQVPKKPAGK
jgi:hypothetical protein